VISDQRSPDSTKIGGWLFRHRTSIPLPFALALLFLRVGEAPASWTLTLAGAVLTLAGEALRLWAVHHIGTISRTRSDRLGPLVTTGPFGYVRNPLYIGNILIWVGFAMTARLVWIAPVVLVLLALEYHAIVRWEEQLLEERRGDEYRDYCLRVGRWMPDLKRKGRKEAYASATSAAFALKPFTWQDTLFSERGTLLAIAAGYLVLWIKLRT
jgi:protein-S-isoprenylcysteine O-methyltransferase Ste14